MRSIHLAPIALVAVVYTAGLGKARSEPINPSNIPDQCTGACSVTISYLISCTTATNLCTNENSKHLEQCIDCLIKGNNLVASDGQMTMDAFVRGCKENGVNVNRLAVGDSLSSSALRLVTNYDVLAAFLVAVVAYIS